MSKVKRSDKKWLLALLITFLVCYIPRMLFGHILIPYAVYDEGTALASAAYAAGKNWTSVTSISAYYGFGYYGLFAPLFKVTDNPYVIYFTIVEINAFVQALYGVIAFGIMRKFFKMDSFLMVSIISCICSYLTTVRPVVYNEVPLVLLNWVAALNLCVLIKNRSDIKKKNIDTILLFGLIAYAFTVHTRSIILLIALLFVVLVYRLLYGEWLISLKMAPFGIGFIAAARCCVKLVQNIVWKAGERTSVANTTIDLGVDSLNIFDLTTWKGFFLVFIGQVSTVNLFSGGLFVMSLYILIKYALLNWKEIKNKDDDRYHMVLALLFLLCCFGMVAGQAMSWMYSIYPHLLNGDTGDVYGYKAFSYIRYMGAFIGPVILCGLVIIHKNKAFMQRIDFFRIIFINLLVLLMWSSYVMPLLDSNPYALEAYVPFCFRKAHDAISIEQYRAALPWYLIICLFLAISCFIKKLNIYYLFVLGLLIFQVSYMAEYNDSYYGEERSRVAALCYEFFGELSKNCEVPETIYAYNTDAQRLQFYLNNYQINPVIPDKALTDTILIYQGKLEELTDIDLEKWNYILLDNNVYFLFQQEGYRDVISSLGYEIL